MADWMVDQMSRAEPNFRGKAKSAQVLGTRVLTPAEVEELWALPAAREPDRIKRLRDSHHRVAQCIGAGMNPTQAGEASGYSQNSVRTLLQAPAFQELVAHYRAEAFKYILDKQNAVMTLVAKNAFTAARQVEDQLEDADTTGQPIPIRDLMSISGDGFDRTGLPKNSTSVNIGVDFADLLARNRAARRADRQREFITAIQQVPAIGDVGRQNPARDDPTTMEMAGGSLHPAPASIRRRF